MNGIDEYPFPWLLVEVKQFAALTGERMDRARGQGVSCFLR